MAQMDMSTIRYLYHCQSSDQKMIKLLSQEGEYQGRYMGMDNAIAATWLVSFNHVVRHQPRAADILQMAAFLVGKDIPMSLFWREDEELEVDEAIGTLKAYAIITEREEGCSFDVHRLVQLAMRHWLQAEGRQEQWIDKTLQRLDDIFSFPVHENRDVWRPYLPHALRAVSFGSYGVEEHAAMASR